MTVCGTGTGNFPQPGDPDLNSPVLSAQAVFGGILVSWSFPELNSHAVAHTRLYRSTNVDPATRILHRRANGDAYFDSFEGEIGTTYYYWIQVVSVNGTLGDLLGPASATVEPTTKQLLQKISGEIDESALSQSLKTEITKIQVNRVDLLAEMQNRFDADTLLGQALNTVEGDVSGLNSALTDEILARAVGQEALVNQSDEILLKANANVEAIQAEAQARAAALQEEVAARIADVAAERDARVAAITQEQGTRAAAISSEQQERVAGDTALANQLVTLTSVVDENTSDISSEQITRANADSAMASDITALQVEVGDNKAAIFEEASVRASDLGLIALQLNAISASYSSNVATINSLETVRISDKEATASRIDTIEVSVEHNEVLIFNEQTARANAVESVASQINVLSAKIDALPTYANGFEPGPEFDNWQVGVGHSLEIESADTFAGSQAGVIGSTESTVNTGTVPFAVSIAIPPGTGEAFNARRLRITFSIKKPSSGASVEMGVGYAKSGGWFSGWNFFAPGASWETLTFFVEVPEGADETHYLVLWGDTSGSGLKVLVDRLLIDVANAELPEITAQITAEQEARATADEALASNINALSGRVGDAETAITDEQTVRASADSAMATDISTLQSAVGDNTAAIVSEQTVRSTADSALAEDISVLSTNVGENATAISNEQTARTDAVSALANDITILQTNVGNNAAAITNEQTTRSDETSALAEDIVTLYAATEDNAAGIINESEARSDETEAISLQVDTLFASMEGANATIAEEAKTRATEDEVLAGVQKVIAASKGTASAAFYGFKEVRVTEHSALATQVQGIDVEMDTAYALIENEQKVRSDGLNALAGEINTLNASVEEKAETYFQSVAPDNPKNGAYWINTDNNNELLIWNATDQLWNDGWDQRILIGMDKNKVFRAASEPVGVNAGDLWFDSDNGDSVYEWDGEKWVPIDLTTGKKLEGVIKENNRAMIGYCKKNGNITEDETPEACEINEGEWIAAQPFAESLKTVQIDDGSDSGLASVQQRMTAYRGELNSLNAQWEVKLNIGDLKGGIGLYLAKDPDDETKDVSHFAARADLLSLGNKNEEQVFPFIIKNGVVYLNSAVMEDAMITNAMIDSLSALKITGLTATFLEARIQNLHVNKISGDVNSIVSSSSSVSRSLPTGDMKVFRELLTIEIPPQTRPRIPLIFSKMDLTVGASDNYSVGVILIEEASGVGSFDDLDTDGSLHSSGRFLTWQRTDFSPAPSFFDSLSPGDEIFMSKDGNWYYARVSGTTSNSNPGGWAFRVYFDWGIFPGETAGVTGQSGFGNIRRRSGSARRYDFDDFVDSSQIFFQANANSLGQYNNYVLSLPRSQVSRSYTLCLSADSPNSVTCESIRTDAVLMR